MGGLLLFMMLGGAAYYAVRMRRNNDIHGSLAARVSELTSQLGQLREAQWKMRTAIDSLREEQDFRNRLATPSDENG